MSTRTIQDKQIIHRLLSQAMDTNTTLLLYSNDNVKVGAGLIAEINKKNTLLKKMVLADAAGALTKKKCACKIIISTKEGVLHYNAKYENKKDVVQLEFPKRIHIIQRRDAFRVTIDSGIVALELENGEMLSGVIMNISVTGMKVLFVKSVAKLITMDQSFPECLIVVSDTVKIQCDLEVARIEQDEFGQNNVVAFRYIWLGREQEEQLGEFIAAQSLRR